MLIRTLFLKRFESSARAFEGSCWRLLKKLLAWVTTHATSEHDQRWLERWRIKSKPDTPRRCAMDRIELSELRKRVELQVVADYLRPLQALVGSRRS